MIGISLFSCFFDRAVFGSCGRISSLFVSSEFDPVFSDSLYVSTALGKRVKDAKWAFLHKPIRKPTGKAIQQSEEFTNEEIYPSICHETSYPLHLNRYS